jgi:hypothetical protein
MGDFSSVDLIFLQMVFVPNRTIDIFLNLRILSSQGKILGIISSLVIIVIVSQSNINMKTASLLQMSTFVGKCVRNRITMKRIEMVIIVLIVLKMFIVLLTVVLMTYRSSNIMASISVTIRNIHVPAIAENGTVAVLREPKRINIASIIDRAIIIESLIRSVK